MLTGIQFSGYNVKEILDFCGSKAIFNFGSLRVRSIKATTQKVHVLDVIVKSERNNIMVIPYNQFITFFKPNETYYKDKSILCSKFILGYKNDISTRPR